MKKIVSSILAATAVTVLSVGPAAAAWNVDAEGRGFVGKGDVQLALNFNNKQLQDNASSLAFEVSAVSETTWDCYKAPNQNGNGEQTQERLRTTTTTGLVSSVARERNQITGFHLTGFSGESTRTFDGPALGSCPGGADWSFVEGSTSTTSADGSVLTVNGVVLATPAA